MDHLIKKKWMVPKHQQQKESANKQVQSNTSTRINTMIVHPISKSKTSIRKLPTHSTSQSNPNIISIRKSSVSISDPSQMSLHQNLLKSTKMTQLPAPTIPLEASKLDFLKQGTSTTAQSVPSQMSLHQNLLKSTKITQLPTLTIPLKASKLDCLKQGTSTTVQSGSLGNAERTVKNVVINGKTIPVKVLQILPAGSNVSQVQDAAGEKSANTSVQVKLFSAKSMQVCLNRKIAGVSGSFEQSGSSNTGSGSSKTNSLDQAGSSGDIIEMRDNIKNIQKTLEKVVECINSKKDNVKANELFPFPLDTLEKHEIFQKKIRQPENRGYLVGLLKKRARKINPTKSVLEELLLLMYTPGLMYQFNATGKKKECFNKTRINQILTEITGLNKKEYRIELARVIHNMHSTHKRHQRKEESEALSRMESDQEDSDEEL